MFVKSDFIKICEEVVTSQR